MVVRLVSPGVSLDTWRRVLGRPQPGGVYNSDVDFDGRHQWRRHELFKLRAKLLQRKNYKFFKKLLGQPVFFDDHSSASKICDSLIYCAPHKK
jgi:hypothetical protein